MDWNKEEVVAYCLDKCKSRVEEIQSAMDSAQDAILNDTKSSMGLQNQLKQAEIDLEKVNGLDLNPSELVRMGSIVQTDQFDYFIAISIGAVKLKDRNIMIISKESPIGNLLLGKKVNESVQFNNKTINIKRVY